MAHLSHLSGIQIGKHARALAAALALGAAVLSLSAGSTFAETNTSAGDGEMCTTTEDDGTIEFHMPGDIVTIVDINGRWHRVQCVHGQWNFVRTGSTGVRPSTGGGVLAPTP